MQFYHPERLYIDSHYDTTHALSYIYLNVTYIDSQLNAQLTLGNHHQREDLSHSHRSRKSIFAQRGNLMAG